MHSKNHRSYVHPQFDLNKKRACIGRNIKNFIKRRGGFSEPLQSLYTEKYVHVFPEIYDFI